MWHHYTVTMVTCLLNYSNANKHTFISSNYSTWQLIIFFWGGGGAYLFVSHLTFTWYSIIEHKMAAVRNRKQTCHLVRESRIHSLLIPMSSYHNNELFSVNFKNREHSIIHWYSISFQWRLVFKISCTHWVTESCRIHPKNTTELLAVWQWTTMVKVGIPVKTVHCKNVRCRNQKHISVFRNA